MEISGRSIIQDCFIQCLKTMVWQVVVLHKYVLNLILMLLEMVVLEATKVFQFHPWYLCSCSCSCPQMIRLDDAVTIVLVRSSPTTSTRFLPHSPTYRSIRVFRIISKVQG